MILCKWLQIFVLYMLKIRPRFGSKRVRSLFTLNENYIPGVLKVFSMIDIIQSWWWWWVCCCWWWRYPFTQISHSKTKLHKFLTIFLFPLFIFFLKISNFELDLDRIFVIFLRANSTTLNSLCKVTILPRYEDLWLPKNYKHKYIYELIR